MSNASTWPGSRLGLPESGSGSLAGAGRRVTALVVDWAACLLISAAFFKTDNFATLGIFLVEQWLLVGTAGFSLGHRLLGMVVRRIDGKPVGLWKSFLRAAAILLLLPPVIWDADNRGLHDKLAGTVLVRR